MEPQNQSLRRVGRSYITDTDVTSRHCALPVLVLESSGRVLGMGISGQLGLAHI